jgi:hypothetical protein
MSIFDQAKEKAEELVEKVKDKFGGDDTDTDTDTDTEQAAAAPPDTSNDAPDTDTPRTIPSDGAVTPADIAEKVIDPDLPHPEHTNEQPKT